MIEHITCEEYVTVRGLDGNINRECGIFKYYGTVERVRLGTGSTPEEAWKKYSFKLVETLNKIVAETKEIWYI